MATVLKESNYQTALRLVIEDRIKRSGVDRPAIAKAAGMRVDYLRHVMNGTRPVSVETLQKLAPAFDTTAEQLHREALALCD